MVTGRGAPDVVIVGAGGGGAACAYLAARAGRRVGRLGRGGARCACFAARAGLRVLVLERGGIAGGTTGAGEGNLLVSDKEPGPELDLALRSLELWHELASTVDGFEFEAEG